jgi:hypothetical protein
MADQQALANAAMAEQEFQEAKPTPEQLQQWLNPDQPWGQHVQLATTAAN